MMNETTNVDLSRNSLPIHPNLLNWYENYLKRGALGVFYTVTTFTIQAREIFLFSSSLKMPEACTVCIRNCVT